MGGSIGALPEFTKDETATPPPEGTVETVTEPVSPETPVPEGQESPVAPPPTNEPTVPPVDEDPVVKALKTERGKLLEEIKTLRGTRREIKQEQIQRVEQKLDELQDLNPQDVSVVERILRSKGYITKEEAQRMSYESTKQEVLDSFLERYPEYKPENDQHDINWSALQRELGYYRMPEDPRKIADVLERAHRQIGGSKPDRTLPVKRQAVATAGLGAGGVQRPAVAATARGLSEAQKETYRRGGWTEEEISKMER